MKTVARPPERIERPDGIERPGAIERPEAGQGLAEYALILALIAIVAIVALIFLGDQIALILGQIGASI